MNDREWNHRIFEHKRAISDIMHYTAAGASISCVDVDHGMIYSTYLASKENYGQTGDCVLLAKIPVGQPEKTETYTVVEAGCVIDGIRAEQFLDCNVYYYQTQEHKTVLTHFHEKGDIYRGFVRVLFLLCPEDYFYTDFDIENGTFSPIRRLNVSFEGKTVPLTGTAYREYMGLHGLSGALRNEKVAENVLSVDKFRLNSDGYRYAFISGVNTQPVFSRIKDGSDTLELIGHIPVECQFEVQSAYLDGVFYAIVRGVPETAEYDAANFWTSADGGRTWQPGSRIEFNTTRPQCLAYDGKILVAISLCNVEPNLVRDGRNNCLLLQGTGSDINSYRKVFHVSDPRGMVYYDITDYNGELYVIFSDGSLHLDKNPQAKDAMFISKIGDLRFID